MLIFSAWSTTEYSVESSNRAIAQKDDILSNRILLVNELTQKMMIGPVLTPQSASNTPHSTAWAVIILRNVHKHYLGAHINESSLRYRNKFNNLWTQLTFVEFAHSQITWWWLRGVPLVAYEDIRARQGSLPHWGLPNSWAWWSWEWLS